MATRCSKLLLSFTLTVSAKPLGMAILAQLADGNWSAVSSVRLQGCELNAQAWSILSRGHFPALAHLNVSGTCLDAESMALLAKGSWPNLRHISLSFNPGIDAVAIAHLSAVNWPLHELDLCYMPVTAAVVAELAKLQLSKLFRIGLCSAHLTSTAMSELARADWPVLRSLDIGSNELDAVAMQYLCRMQLPSLKILRLLRANLTSEGAYWLASGVWPLLTDLDLSFNRVDAKGVKHIANGVWPSLQCLLLVGNPVGDGLKQLTKSDWPLLNCSRISLGMLEMRRSDAVCLGLDPDKVQELKCNARHQGGSLTLDRNVSRACMCSHLWWPALHKVMIVR